MLLPTLFPTSLLSVEVGSRVLHEPTPTVGITVTSEDFGPWNTDFEYGVDLMGPYKDDSNTIQLRAQLVKSFRYFDAGVGFYYLNHDLPIVCDLGFHLLGRVKFTDNISLQWRHSSTADLCYPNSGMDLLTLNIKF